MTDMMTAPAPIDMAPKNQTSLGSGKCQILVLNTGMPGNTKGVSKEKVDMKNMSAEESRRAKARISISEKLFDHPTYRAVNAFDQQTQLHCQSRSVGSPKRGLYIIPTQDQMGAFTTLLLNLYDYLENRIKERAELAEKFLAEYPAILERAKKENPLFEAGRYPSVETLRAAFVMGYRFMAFDSLGASDLPVHIAHAEAKKQQAYLGGLAKETMRDLRKGLEDLVAGMHDVLSNDKKVFTTRVSQFKDFLSVFDDLNQGKDQDLSALAQKAAQLLAGVEAEDLKTVTKKTKEGSIIAPVNAPLKEKVKQGMADILATLKENAVEQASRQVSDDLFDF